MRQEETLHLKLKVFIRVILVLAIHEENFMKDCRSSIKTGVLEVWTSVSLPG